MQFYSKHMAWLNCLCICQVTVGTNPISVAAPGKDGDSFVLDMATSAVALGKVGVETGKKVICFRGNTDLNKLLTNIDQ